MVASPSDAHEERQAVASVLNEWNSLHALDSGIVLLPLRWEVDAFPELGGEPQSIIHKQLTDQADILVAVFKTKIGSPTSQAISGTVEEIQRFMDHSKPVLLYFSDAPLQPSSMDLTQYQGVIDFKKSIEKKGLYGQFTSLDQFRTQLQAHVTRLVREITQISENSTIVTLPPSPETLRVQESTTVSPAYYRPAFSELQTQWIRERSSGPTSITTAKAIIEGLGSLLQGIRSAPSALQTPELPAALNSILAQVQSIKRHRLNLDGGMSLRAFWDQGNQIFDQTETVIASLEKGSSQARSN